MRPIKFRAWDSIANVVRTSEDLANSDIYLSVEGHFVAPDEDGEMVILFHLEPIWSTGLHDKNSKDIWEGDVVRGPNGFKHQVSFGEIGVRGRAMGFYLWDAEVEVLGNIYENPELLTSTERKEKSE